MRNPRLRHALILLFVATTPGAGAQAPELTARDSAQIGRLAMQWRSARASADSVNRYRGVLALADSLREGVSELPSVRTIKGLAALALARDALGRALRTDTCYSARLSDSLVVVSFRSLQLGDHGPLNDRRGQVISELQAIMARADSAKRRLCPAG